MSKKRSPKKGDIVLSSGWIRAALIASGMIHPFLNLWHFNVATPLAGSDGTMRRR